MSTLHLESLNSLIYTRMQRNSIEASFCMDVGQVKTGEDKDDTYVKMLQQVVRVTLPIAYGIASRYPSVVSLVEAFRKNGPLVLEDLKVRWTRFLVIILSFADYV